MIDLPDIFHLDSLREAKVRTEDLDSFSFNLGDEGPIPSQDHSRAELEISQNKGTYQYLSLAMARTMSPSMTTKSGSWSELWPVL